MHTLLLGLDFKRAIHSSYVFRVTVFCSAKSDRLDHPGYTAIRTTKSLNLGVVYLTGRVDVNMKLSSSEESKYEESNLPAAP
jgi:hypothetical protein